MKNLQLHGLLDSDNTNSLIIYADDQFVSQEALIMNFNDIGIGGRLLTVANGKEVVDLLDNLL